MGSRQSDPLIILNYKYIMRFKKHELIYYSYKQMDEERLNKALQQLQLRTKNNDEDRAQLNEILFEVLSYPSITEAQKHHRANNLGTSDLLSSQQQMQKMIRDKQAKNLSVCGCCGILCQEEKQLPFCTSFEELKIGVGVHLYFWNYSYNALVFLLLALIYSIYAVVTNLEASVGADRVLCILNDDECGLSNIGAGSKILKDDKNQVFMYIQVQSILSIVAIGLWGIMNIIKTHREEIFIVEMDSKRVSASDFTLMLTHVQRKYLIGTDEEIVAEFDKRFRDYSQQINSLYSYDIIKVNIARPLYNQSQHNKKTKEYLKQELNNRQEVFRKWLHYRKAHIQFPVDSETRKAEYQRYISFFTEEYDLPSLSDVPLDNDNLVFVTFRSSKAREEIQKMNPAPAWDNCWNCFHERSPPIPGATVRKAPQPEQIKWELVGYPVESKNCRKIIIFFLTFLLISISLGISCGIAFIDQGINQYVSIAISLVITIANALLQMGLIYASYYENQFITTVEQSNVAFKIGIAQLFNSIGVPIVVTAIKFSESKEDWLKSGSLVDDVFFIALFNLIAPFARFLDPYNIILNIQRWFYGDPWRRIQMYRQNQLNSYYGNYSFDMGYQYAYLIKTCIFTAFFMPMQPIIAFFAPIGLILYYLANKYNLFYHFMRPAFHSSAVNDVVGMLLLLSPLAFAIGQIFVNFLITNQTYPTETILILDIITALVAFLFLLIVPLRVFYCCMQQPEFDQWDYYDKKPLLQTDYDRMNPITKEKAIKEFQHYLNQLEQKQELPDHAQMVKFTVSNIRLRNPPRESLEKRKSKFMESMMYNAPSYNQNLDEYRNIIIQNSLGTDNRNFQSNEYFR